MKNYYELLKKTSLFEDFSTQEIEYIEKALNLSVTSFAKNSVIFSQGDTVQKAGLLLEGTINAESVSYSGERRLIQTHTKGSVFADVLMSSVNHPTPVSVIAKEDSKVVFIDFEKLTENACNPICRKVLANMLHGIADKFWLLNRKIAYISCKSLRSRIAMFLLDMQKELKQSTFSVPYNREELASLLGANRSALSRELSRMQDENIISYYKNSFKIEEQQKLKNCL
ncbi:MAG: Crp/Fnr family transcriptional regulator [Ruminococcaceae bacterium]|nr:Crp/Fnr family transcriptional regulator [Oscillospiraceae bacterium]